MFLLFFTVNALISFAGLETVSTLETVEKTEKKECVQVIEPMSDGCNFEKILKCRTKENGEWSKWKIKEISTTTAYCENE